MSTCRTCGVKFTPKETRTDRIVGVYCSQRCLGRRDKTGSKNPKWRGGRETRKDGRSIVYAPGHPNATLRGGKSILEYRLIMSSHLGRPLLPTEIVHHKNGNPSDNRIENLEVMTHEEHNIEHMRGRSRSTETGRLLKETK